MAPFAPHMRLVSSSDLRRLMQEISTRFEYKPRSTRVDSPIDEVLSLSADPVPFTPWMSRDAGVQVPLTDSQAEQQQQ